MLLHLSAFGVSVKLPESGSPTCQWSTNSESKRFRNPILSQKDQINFRIRVPFRQGARGQCQCRGWQGGVGVLGGGAGRAAFPELAFTLVSISAQSQQGCESKLFQPQESRPPPTLTPSPESECKLPPAYKAKQLGSSTAKLVLSVLSFSRK